MTVTTAELCFLLPELQKRIRRSAHAQKETEFLRLKRTRLGLEDFESLKVIGRGAFGEVGPGRMATSFFTCHCCLLKAYVVYTSWRLLKWLNLSELTELPCCCHALCSDLGLGSLVQLNEMGAETQICGVVWWQCCVWVKLCVLSRCVLSRRKTRATFMPWKSCVKLICWRKSRWIAALMSSATSVPWVTLGGNCDVWRAAMGILGLLAKAAMWFFLPYFAWRKWECCQAVVSCSALRWIWEVLCGHKTRNWIQCLNRLVPNPAALCLLGATLLSGALLPGCWKELKQGPEGHAACLEKSWFSSCPVVRDLHKHGDTSVYTTQLLI